MILDDLDEEGRCQHRLDTRQERDLEELENQEYEEEEDVTESHCWPLISNGRTREKAKEISKSQIPIFPNFLGLVLGCIEAKFCK